MSNDPNDDAEHVRRTNLTTAATAVVKLNPSRPLHPPLASDLHRQQSADITNINLNLSSRLPSTVGYVKPNDNEQHVRGPNITTAATDVVKLNPSRPLHPPLAIYLKAQVASTEAKSNIQKDVVMQPKIMLLMYKNVPPPAQPKMPDVQKIPPKSSGGPTLCHFFQTLFGKKKTPRRQM
jgi:hypothetical protein